MHDQQAEDPPGTEHGATSASATPGTQPEQESAQPEQETETENAKRDEQPKPKKPETARKQRQTAASLACLEDRREHQQAHLED